MQHRTGELLMPATHSATLAAAASDCLTASRGRGAHLLADAGRALEQHGLGQGELLGLAGSCRHSGGGRDGSLDCHALVMGPAAERMQPSRWAD